MASSTEQREDPFANGMVPEELQLSQRQDADSDIGPILKLKMQSNEQPDISQMVAESADTKTLLSLWNQLEVRDGALYRRWNGGEREPKSFKS